MFGVHWVRSFCYVQRTDAVLLPLGKTPDILVYQINHLHPMYLHLLNEPTFQSLNRFHTEAFPVKAVRIDLASIPSKSKILHTTAEDLKQGSIHEEVAAITRRRHVPVDHTPSVPRYRQDLHIRRAKRADSTEYPPLSDPQIYRLFSMKLNQRSSSIKSTQSSIFPSPARRVLARHFWQPPTNDLGSSGVYDDMHRGSAFSGPCFTR
jgi:hypothetical protein